MLDYHIQDLDHTAFWFPVLPAVANIIAFRPVSL